jgi:hypothetical protein
VIKLLEAIFRRFILLLLMLVVPLIIGLGIGYATPRSYQASANLWALQRYTIIGATGAESNLTATPAETQTSALSELLKTRTFDVAVGNATDLKSTLGLSAQDLADPEALGNAYVADLSKNVQAFPNGSNLYQISYTNRNAHVAFQVVKSLIKEFQLQGQQFSITDGERLLQGDEAQLPKLQNDANAAAAAESAYLAAHPSSTLTNDPQYALLDSQRIQAQTVLQGMQTTIANLKQDIAMQSAGGGAFFKTLDPPVEPDVALSRSKALTTAGGIGAAIGLVACFLYVLIIMRRDRALYTVLDVTKVTSYPILMQLPKLPSKAKELVLVDSTK